MVVASKFIIFMHVLMHSFTHNLTIIVNICLVVDILYIWRETAYIPYMKREEKKIVNACNGKIKIYIFNVIPMHVMIQQLTYMCVLNGVTRVRTNKNSYFHHFTSQIRTMSMSILASLMGGVVEN